MTTARASIWMVFAIALTGCGSTGSSGTKTTYSYVDEDQAKAAKQGQPFEDPSKVAPKSVTKADLAALKKVLDEDTATYKADESDANRKKVVDATVELASKTMDCEDLTPKQKYPAALRLYRAALVLDPKNPDANEAASTIVAIYKQMGKPVPE